MANAAGNGDDTMSIEQAQEAVSIKQDSALQQHYKDIDNDEEYGEMRQSANANNDADVDQGEDGSQDKRIQSSQVLMDGYASLDRVGAAQIDSGPEQAQADGFEKIQESHEVHIFDDTVRSSGERPEFQSIAMQINNNSSEEAERVSG